MNKVFSEIFSLSKSDVVKAFVIAVLTPAVGYLYQILQGGGDGLDWAQLGKLALSGGVAYIIKQYFSDNQGNVLGIGSHVSGEITP
jgi:hypothetical protein